METELAPLEGGEMQLPDATRIADFIKISDLTLEEMDALRQTDDSIRDGLTRCAEAFIQLAAKVRPEVLYEFGELYGLSRDALDAAIRQGSAGIRQLQADQRKVRDAAILAKRAEGKTQQQIAEDLDTDKGSVSKVLVCCNDQHTSIDCRVKADDVVVAEVQQRLAAGQKHGAIAEATGLSRQRVGQIANGKTGNESKRKGINTLDDQAKAEIVQRLSAGESGNAIAKDLGLSNHTIYRIRDEAGSRPPELPQMPTEGKTIEHSKSFHSPSLARLRTGGTPENLTMESYRVQFMQAVARTVLETTAIESRLLKLQRRIQEDYAQYHGHMIARWAAYEKVWEDELIESVGVSSFAEVTQTLQARLRLTSRKISECLATLDKMQTIDYIIEE